MSSRCFGVLTAAYALATALFAGVVYWQTNEVDGLHFAIDTMTLRGRIADPPDCKLKHPWVFKAAEDVAALLVFVILGFGLAFHTAMVEGVMTRRQFARETGAGRAGGVKTWQEWLRERDPAMYEEYYGDGAKPEGRWKRFKRWLMKFPR